MIAERAEALICWALLVSAFPDCNLLAESLRESFLFEIVVKLLLFGGDSDGVDGTI